MQMGERHLTGRLLGESSAESVLVLTPRSRSSLRRALPRSFLNGMLPLPPRRRRCSSSHARRHTQTQSMCERRSVGCSGTAAHDGNMPHFTCAGVHRRKKRLRGVAGRKEGRNRRRTFQLRAHSRARDRHAQQQSRITVRLRQDAEAERKTTYDCLERVVTWVALRSTHARALTRTTKAGASSLSSCTPPQL